MSEKLDWQFIMPAAVLCELNKKEVSALSSLLNDTISIDVCTDIQHSRIETQLKGLGDGEGEVICIVSQCADKTFKNYVILMDDKRAKNRAEQLGIRAIGTLGFLRTTNNEGMLSKRDAIQAVNVLKKHRYSTPQDIMEDFIAKLN